MEVNNKPGQISPPSYEVASRQDGSANQDYSASMPGNCTQNPPYPVMTNNYSNPAMYNQNFSSPEPPPSYFDPPAQENHVRVVRVVQTYPTQQQQTMIIEQQRRRKTIFCVTLFLILVTFASVLVITLL